MNKSEIAEKAAREILAVAQDTYPLTETLIEIFKARIERAVAESQAPQPCRNAGDSESLAEISELVLGYREGKNADIISRVKYLKTLELGDGEPSPPFDKTPQEFYDGIYQGDNGCEIWQGFDEACKFAEAYHKWRSGAAQEVSPPSPEPNECDVCGKPEQDAIHDSWKKGCHKFAAKRTELQHRAYAYLHRDEGIPSNWLDALVEFAQSELAAAQPDGWAKSRELYAELFQAKQEIIKAEGDTRELKAALRWIPVEERLPKDSGSYLIVFRSRLVDKAWFNDAYKVWGNNPDGSSWNVTHWQPLPKPPELR